MKEGKGTYNPLLANERVSDGHDLEEDGEEKRRPNCKKTQYIPVHRSIHGRRWGREEAAQL